MRRSAHITGKAEPERSRTSSAGDPAPGQAPSVHGKSWRSELSALDRALYAAVAETATPQLDAALRPLTSAADYSRLWLGTAAVMALTGGSTGRRSALHGIVAIGLASVTVNQVFKRASQRTRPDRDSAFVPDARRVRMPTSTSFPSGHSASAFAFAEAIGHTLPWVAGPVRLAALVVAFTRVHSGVHYPGDVIAGILIGIACGELAPMAVDGALARWHRSRKPSSPLSVGNPPHRH